MSAIPENTPIETFAHWHDGEFAWCRDMLANHGHEYVSNTEPKIVAQYLQCQGTSAIRDKEYEIAARLFTAAGCLLYGINRPDWTMAVAVMDYGPAHLSRKGE